MAARPRGPAGFTVSVRRLHTWLGLLSFAHLMIYGVAGLTATFQTSKERPKIARSVRYEPFRADPNATDREVAAAVYRKLDLPFTRPMPDWFLRRTADHHLLLDFYQINGIYRVVVLEDEQRLRIEEIRNGIWLFLEDMHAVTREDGPHLRLLRWWSYYNELAMWTLLAMILSGLYLWLAARRFRVWWAAVCFVSGTSVVVAFYEALR